MEISQSQDSSLADFLKEGGGLTQLREKISTIEGEELYPDELKDRIGGRLDSLKIFLQSGGKGVFKLWESSQESGFLEPDSLRTAFEESLKEPAAYWKDHGDAWELAKISTTTSRLSNFILSETLDTKNEGKPVMLQLKHK